MRHYQTGGISLSTTQLYLNAEVRDVVETMLAFYAARTEHPAAPAEGYRPESLEVLFPKDAK